MLKRHTCWLWTAVVFLFLTGALHSIGLFVTPTGRMIPNVDVAPDDDTNRTCSAFTQRCGTCLSP